MKYDSMTNRFFRPGTAIAAGAATLLLALAVTARAEPGNDNRAPLLEGELAKLRVEEGNKVIAHGFAIGVQTYRWDGTAWIFVAPTAVLYEDEGLHGEFATHFAGPTWQTNSGSFVVAAADKSFAPDPDSIPWVLLHATATGGDGIFAGVTFVQRVNTVGGKAPADSGRAVGEVADVPYTAEYFFYRAQR